MAFPLIFQIQIALEEKIKFLKNINNLNEIKVNN